jgi:multidrug efflux pump
MAGVALIAGLLVIGFVNLPSSFLPEEDQGYFMTSFQLPADATATRTLEAVRVRAFRGRASRCRDHAGDPGFGFSGSGANAAMIYTMLKPGADVRAEIAAADAAMGKAIHEGQVMNLMPPAIDELGTSAGFTLRLEDRAGKGRAALGDARDRLLEQAARSDRLSNVYADGLPGGTSVRLDIDRARARAMGCRSARSPTWSARRWAAAM